MYFANKILKSDNFSWNCRFFEICRQNTTTSTETNSITIHFLFIHCTSKNSTPFKNNKKAKKLPVFGKTDFHRLSNLLQTQIFWNFDHISRTYNHTNTRSRTLNSHLVFLIAFTANSASWTLYSANNAR